jgi:hypothetical protein
MERGFRALAVIDQWSRESLAIEVDRSLTGAGEASARRELNPANTMPRLESRPPPHEYPAAL